MPGVDEKRLKVTLEKNVEDHGAVESDAFLGHNIAYAEYDVSDYERPLPFHEVIVAIEAEKRRPEDRPAQG
jgi:hypothetical protein